MCAWILQEESTKTLNDKNAYEPEPQQTVEKDKVAAGFIWTSESDDDGKNDEDEGDHDVPVSQDGDKNKTDDAAKSDGLGQGDVKKF